MASLKKGDRVSVEKDDAWCAGTVQAVDNIDERVYLDMLIEGGVMCLILPNDQDRIRR